MNAISALVDKLRARPSDEYVLDVFCLMFFILIGVVSYLCWTITNDIKEYLASDISVEVIVNK